MSQLSSTLRRNQRQILRTVLGSIGLVAVLAAIQLASMVWTDFRQMATPAPAGFYKVLEVADGDTFTVAMDGIEERVRLVGVDTPETHHPSKPAQCFGREASEFSKSLLAGKNVRLTPDTKQANRDRYGRLLRYAHLEDGRELNELLVSQGYAFGTNFNTEKKPLLRRLQEEAKNAKFGLWAACTVTEKSGQLRTNDL